MNAKFFFRFFKKDLKNISSARLPFSSDTDNSWAISLQKKTVLVYVNYLASRSMNFFSKCIVNIFGSKSGHFKIIHSLKKQDFQHLMAFPSSAAHSHSTLCKNHQILKKCSFFEKNYEVLFTFLLLLLIPFLKFFAY